MTRHLKFFLGASVALGTLLFPLVHFYPVEVANGSDTLAIQVAEVTSGPLSKQIKVSGELVPASRRALSSVVSGIVDDIAFVVGDEVKAGDIVARISSPRQEAIVVGLKEEIEGLNAVYAAYSKEVARLRYLFDARERLAERNVVTREALRASRSDLELAEADLKTTETELRKLEANLSSEEFIFEQRVIRAPINGILFERLVDVGGVYDPSNEDGTLVILADLSKMHAELWFSETDIREVRVGMLVAISLLGESESEIIAPIVRVLPSPRLISGVTVYIAEIEINNEHHRFLSGMGVRGTLTLAEIGSALVVPASAVARDDSGNAWVFRVVNDRYIKVPVKPLLETRTQIAVSGQVYEGDLVAQFASSVPEKQ